MPAELILHSGQIHTMDARGTVVEALASWRGRIAALGRDAEVLALRSRRTKVVDLKGRFACPGFIDCHTHFAKRALGITRVDLHGAPSRRAMVARLVRQAKGTPKGGWVLGRGWDDSRWADRRFPNRHDLDRAISDRPVKASRVDGHSCVVNTMGWQVLGLPKDFPGVELGGDGEPTGVLKEQAYEETLDRIPDPPRLYRKALPRMERGALELGVTTVCDFVDPKDLAAYRERQGAGKLGVRVVAALWSRHLPELEAGSLGRVGGDLWLRLSGLKLYGDGSIGSRTAAMLAPYRDDPSTRGALNMTRTEMARVIRRARALGLQACIHAIGDRGVREVIAAFEEAAKGAGAGFAAERHRIEHCELVTKEGIARMRALGLVASVQPNFVGNWSAKGALYDQRVGPGWLGRDNPMRWLVDGGVRVAFGSDNMPFGPLYGIHSAVNAPFPAQRLSVEEALCAYTRDAAFALREGETRGTLEQGKLTDVVVLGASPFERPEAIRSVRVELTVIGGRVAFRRPPRVTPRRQARAPAGAGASRAPRRPGGARAP